MSKVYVIYAKKDIVAWTDDIDLAEWYCHLRGDMYKYKLKKYKNFPDNIKLIGEVLNNGVVDTVVPMTPDEYFILGEEWDNIIKLSDKNIKKFPLKERYLDSILSLTEEIKRSSTRVQTIDTVALFCNLFANRFK